MPLSSGDRLGPYEIVDLIGAGGMGQVYRARDTRLDRTVAIKISSEQFGERAEREARAVAALNHPNICTLHDVGPAYFVMEYLEGPTLGERIAAGPLALAEVLPIARQIAEAVEAAHEKGIVHRDLKPANVKVTLDGTVKILDFGLAKSIPGETPASDGSLLETLTIDATREGVILGTAPYMSPEQARGKPVDKRTDIWAFGCILYEMITGLRAFPGETLADTIAAVLGREPDWVALEKRSPANLRKVVERCLCKDPKLRLRDIGDVRIELDDVSVNQTALSHPPAATVHRVWQYLAWCLAGILLATLVLVIAFRRGELPPIPAPITRTAVVLPAGLKLASGEAAYPLAVSPDGARLAYIAEEDGRTQLYIRELSDLDSKALAGTLGARHAFFSPDGQWIGFFTADSLQKVSVAGGAPIRICSVAGRVMGGDWGPDNAIVFALRGSGLHKVDAAGGTPKPVPGADRAAWPSILPGGKLILFTRQEGIAVIPIGGGAPRFVAGTTNSALSAPSLLGVGAIVQARFLPSGYLVYGQSRGLVRAMRFDVASLTVSGSPVPILDSVEQGTASGGIYFAVSATGLFVYATSGDRHQLVWVDRNGISTPISPDREAFRNPRISPDGKRIAVAINDETRRSDIWIYDADRGTRNRLTTTLHNVCPVWTPDGVQITYCDGTISELRADGSGAKNVLLSFEKQGDRTRSLYPTSWSPDGRFLLFNSDGPTSVDVWVLPRNDVGHPLLAGPYNEYNAQFSPDGRWVAYSSDESGNYKVYAVRFPGMDGKVTISTDAGSVPKWSRDGREIFYRQGDALMSVAVDTSRGFRAEKPQRLFTGDYSGASRDAQFDVSLNGRRFVMVKSDDSSTLRQVMVVQNWLAELKRRLPAQGR